MQKALPPPFSMSAKLMVLHGEAKSYNKVRAVMCKQQISVNALLKGNQRIAAVKYSPLVQEGRPLRLFRGDLFHPMRKQIQCTGEPKCFFRSSLLLNQFC